MTESDWAPFDQDDNAESLLAGKTMRFYSLATVLAYIAQCPELKVVDACWETIDPRTKRERPELAHITHRTIATVRLDVAAFRSRLAASPGGSNDELQILCMYAHNAQILALSPLDNWIGHLIFPKDLRIMADALEKIEALAQP